MSGSDSPSENETASRPAIRCGNRSEQCERQGPLVESQSSPNASLPLRDLLLPSASVIGALSTLSVEQISQIEATLRRVKLGKIQSADEIGSASGTSSRPNANHQPTQKPQNQTNDMGQFLSVIRPIHSKIPPAAAPTVKFMAGVPWLNFTYSTKSGSTSYTIRVDIDAVDMTGISSELRVANCLYPSADGPKEQYNGTRREYERECNEQGWKLVLLNPTQLDGKRGVLQRAVVCLRNVNAEQKSRRARRQELAVQRSLKSPVQRQVMAIPRLPGSKHVGQPCRPRTGTQASLARSITWQPVQVSTTAQAGQRSFAPSSTPGSALYGLFSESSLTQRHGLSSMRGRPSSQQLPSVGVFRPSTSYPHSADDPGQFLLFDGYVEGQMKRLCIRHSIDHIRVEDLPFGFKKTNCVYPRSFLVEEGDPQHWKPGGVRQAEESYLNEIGWKLCAVNQALLDGKRLLLQQALDAYRKRFLPSTCQPRARVGPSILTGRTFESSLEPEGFSRPNHFHHNHHNHHCHRRQQQRRVHFEAQDSFKRKPLSRRSSRSGHTDNLMSEHNPDIEDREDEDEEEEDVDSEAESSEDESEDGSSSEGGFHSQLSLLSFTGSISTYSLGTGSGSARSRPRITPTPPKHISAPRPLISSSTSSSSAKRSVAGPSSSTEQKERSRRLKRRRYHHSGDQDNEDEESQERDESMEKHGEDTSEKEDEENMEADLTLEQNADEDEDDWWMSRLKNSEYPEDHDFVSMTTEELINALTSGYNSDVEDEDEVGEDEDEALWC
ncbi:hypothetical protein BC939DRAFT_497571 [Gamsiella multidivaricata]|uniref:uncharacterized protein n=1 Tax=Gamsiella multidivaricata TaxID=101098 RepID=UPI00221EFACF|nr:uncharacterized protein BC939DRAFT_497571 [Gamsiella multidivaricata]KAI7816236.1 hypothetical protein BC939DRAFT_497571 [Gamsiella multidivaricata]